MFNIYTLEVLEDFTYYWDIYKIDYIKGDRIVVTKTIGKNYQKLIDTGKLKIEKSLIGRGQ